MAIHIIDQNGKFGFTSIDGKLICPCIFDNISFFDAAKEFGDVTFSSKHGIINERGVMLTDCEFDEIIGIHPIGIAIANKWSYRIDFGKDDLQTWSIKDNDDYETLKYDAGRRKSYLVFLETGRTINFADVDEFIYITEAGFTIGADFLSHIIFKRNDRYGAYNLRGELIIDNCQTIEAVEKSWKEYNDNL